MYLLPCSKAKKCTRRLLIKACRFKRSSSMTWISWTDMSKAALLDFRPLRILSLVKQCISLHKTSQMPVWKSMACYSAITRGSLLKREKPLRLSGRSHRCLPISVSGWHSPWTRCADLSLCPHRQSCICSFGLAYHKHCWESPLSLIWLLLNLVDAAAGHLFYCAHCTRVSYLTWFNSQAHTL